MYVNDCIKSKFIMNFNLLHGLLVGMLNFESSIFMCRNKKKEHEMVSRPVECDISYLFAPTGTSCLIQLSHQRIHNSCCFGECVVSIKCNKSYLIFEFTSLRKFMNP